MTGEELRAFMNKESLRIADVAWLLRKTVRQVANWLRHNKVPDDCSLLIAALKEGYITYSWFKDHIEAPIPD